MQHLHAACPGTVLLVIPKDSKPLKYVDVEHPFLKAPCAAPVRIQECMYQESHG